MIPLFLPFAFLASAITTNKLILRDLPAILFVGIRMLIAGTTLLTFVMMSKKRSTFFASFQKYYSIFIVPALFTTFFPALFKAYALKHTLSSKVALIGSLDPFITALYVYVLFGEKLSRNKVLGIMLGFIGSATLVIMHSQQSSTWELFGFLSKAELAAFASVILSRYGWIKVQQILKSHIFSPVQVNAITMIGGGSLALLTAYFFGETLAASTEFSGKIYALMTYTVIAGNIIGYTLYGKILKEYSATFVALAGFTIPLFVYFFGWLILGEPLYISFFISATITFAGLLFFYKDELNKSKSFSTKS